MVAHWSGHQPELTILGLPWGPLGAGLAAKALDLVVVSSPFLALDGNRRLRPELGWLLHREWLHIRPHRGGGDRGWHIHAGLGLRPVGVRRVGAVGFALGNDLGSNLLSDLDAVRLGLAR